jgi:hypothetical protein
MFNKLTFKERYYIFIALCLVWMVGYQSYCIYRTDTLVYEALEEGNKRVTRYVEIIQESRREKEGLSHDLLHEQVTNKALKVQIATFEEQIDVISEFWRKECMKARDELFDLKYKEDKID